MKFLLYSWKVYNQTDIRTAFLRNGHSMDVYEEGDEARQNPESSELSKVAEGYDGVFSVNFFPHVSNICQSLGKIYIAWTVDSPMIAMHHNAVFNHCNYVFVFDQFYYYQFKQLGVEHIYYLPLAVDTIRLDHLLEASPLWERKMYQSDIAFVGGMYHKNSYDSIKDKLSPYLQGYFDAAMLAQMDIYGENIFDQLLTVDILEQLCETVKFENNKDSFSDIRLVFASTFLGYKLAQMERVGCLNRLAKHHNVSLYTDEMDDNLIGVHLKGRVHYQYDMPKVFRNSKINLNFTIRNIRSGIPLRVWDILGAGGFLLTNFQAELPSYFENGKDIVYFESMADMEEKVDYYLEHEEEREQIARNGHDKVKKLHSYDRRVRKILDIIAEDRNIKL